MFFGADCVERFCRFLFCRKHKGATAVAHNSRGYDLQFILQYIHKMEHAMVPKIITRGLELMMVKVGGIRVIDSLNFLPMPLAKLPKTFGVDEVKKGHFPHYFNLLHNQNYVGEWPAAHFYGPDNMKEEDRREFMKWHAEQTGRKFDF